MDSKIIILLIFISILSYQLHCCTAQPWTKAGYWYAGSESPIPDINSALFTHLICDFANVSSTTYQLSIPQSRNNTFLPSPTLSKVRTHQLSHFYQSGMDKLQLLKPYWVRKSILQYCLQCLTNLLTESLSLNPQ